MIKKFILLAAALTVATAASFADNIRFASHPSLSPDGKQIYFSYDGDIYSVPAGGGKAVQLTFHEAPDTPVGWSPKSDWIYFESTRAGARKATFKVGVAGGTPQLLFDGYFNTVVNLCENPRTGEFLFNESMESISFPTPDGEDFYDRQPLAVRRILGHVDTGEGIRSVAARPWFY